MIAGAIAASGAAAVPAARADTAPAPAADAAAPGAPAAPAPAPADPAAPEEVIVVVGLLLPGPLREAPAAATVLDRAQLRRAPHALADELVRLAPAAGTFRRSASTVADPTSQGLSLRGVGPSGVSRALVLRDGVPANDPFGGWIYWRAIAPLGIDRIEIVPSGASAVFGNAALGGVLHLLSRPIAPRTVEAVLAGGSLGTGRAAARATDRAGELGLELEGEALHTGGYAPIAPAQRGPVDGRAASTHGTAGARLEHARGGSTLRATARYFRESLDAGTRFTSARVRAVTYGLAWRLARHAGTLDVQLFGGDQLLRQDRARVAPGRATAALASGQRTPSQDQGASAAWTARAGRHELVLGADARRVAGTATDALAPAMPAPDALVSRAAGGEQRFAGAFAQHALRAGPLDVTAALRLDAWQQRAGRRTLVRADGTRDEARLPDRAGRQLDPRVGVLARASEAVALRASVYRAFRAPTLNELYRPFQVGTVLTAANDALAPETLWGGEAGTAITTRGLAVQATAFWNRLRGAIANVTLAEPIEGAARQRQNLGRTRIAGLELDLAWRPGPAWTLRIGHAFTDARVIAAPAQPELAGRRLAQLPRQRTVGSLALEAAGVTATAQVRYLGPQFEDDLETLPIGAVVLVDARVERALGRGLSAFATVQNALDRRYLVGRAGVDTEGAPRTLEVGLAFRAAAAPRPARQP